jgi:hypothetical protein
MHRDEQLVDRIAQLENLDREDVARILKASVKEALKEWLDEKILIFGKWSIVTVASAGLVAIVYFILSLNGWKHEP